MSDAPVTSIGLVGGVGTIAASATFRAASAAAHTFPGAASGAVTLTAKVAGTAGNEIWADFDVKKDAEGSPVANHALQFVVSAKGAQVFLATNGSGVPTSTATQVASGFNASPASGFATAAAQTGGSGVVAASGFALLSGGADAVVMEVGDTFDLWSVDETNAVILPHIDNETDFYAATDAVTVPLATLLAACAPDAVQ